LSIRNLVFRDTTQSLHDKLIAVLEASNVDLDGELKDETSLIESGKLDSLGLFNLALFIERETDGKVDITAFDLAKEWNTITDILNFIAKLRSSG
jgi:acyl carrier protein